MFYFTEHLPACPPGIFLVLYLSNIPTKSPTLCQTQRKLKKVPVARQGGHKPKGEKQTSSKANKGSDLANPKSSKTKGDNDDLDYDNTSQMGQDDEWMMNKAFI